MLHHAFGFALAAAILVAPMPASGQARPTETGGRDRCGGA